MSEAFFEKERDLKKKVSLGIDKGGIKVINVEEYLDTAFKKFNKIIGDVTNESEAKILFLDFLELKNNIEEVYMPSSDMDEYTLDKINNAYTILCNIYGLILSVSPTIYSSQIQYFAYSSLFSEEDHLLFFKHLFKEIASNFEVARYTVAVFKEVIFVHNDLDINNNINDNVVDVINALVELCKDAGLDENIELEGLVN